MKEVIFNKISQALNPARLEVLDQSALHQGHAGARDGGESHFQIIITDPLLAKQNKISTHRLIHQILESELKNQIHALSILLNEK